MLKYKIVTTEEQQMALVRAIKERNSDREDIFIEVTTLGTRKLSVGAIGAEPVILSILDNVLDDFPQSQYVNSWNDERRTGV